MVSETCQMGCQDPKEVMFRPDPSREVDQIWAKGAWC